MTIDPIKIPQNVYIEDRIVGPLTLKQILIVGIGAGISYVLYSASAKSNGAVSVPMTAITWTPAAIAAAFAFLRINDVSLFRIILLLIERINKPAIRTMEPRRGITINIRTFSAPGQKNAAVSRGPAKNMEQIEELSSILDLSMPSLVPAAAGGAKEPISPLSEHVEEAENTPVRPVDPSRISVSTIDPPANGTVSIFRDLSPS